MSGDALTGTTNEAHHGLPVCTNAATEGIPHTIDGRAFGCPDCGEYQISGTVYEPGC